MDDLIVKMKSQIGNAHTRNKAIFYLDIWEKQINELTVGKTKRENLIKMREILEKECRKALLNNDWKNIKILLTGLW